MSYRSFPYPSWLLVYCGGMVLAFLVALAGPGLPLLVAFAGASLFGLQVMARREWSNEYWLGGPANVLTSLRLLGVLLIGLSEAPPLLYALAGLAVIGLDGVDGPLARHYRTESRFGALFDAEVDALFVLILSWKLWAVGFHDAWILGMGLVRYVYALPDLLLPRPERPKESGAYARIIAGIVMVGLPLAFIFPEFITRPGAPGLALLLAYSFGRSAWERFRPLI